MQGLAMGKNIIASTVNGIELVTRCTRPDRPHLRKGFLRSHTKMSRYLIAPEFVIAPTSRAVAGPFAAGQINSRVGCAELYEARRHCRRRT